jgi:hypothetical protein
MRVQDWKGNEIKVGTKVLYGAPVESDDVEDYKAEVIAISDPDVVYNPVTDADDGGYEVKITIRLLKSGDPDELRASYVSPKDYSDDKELFEEGGDLEVITD